jgi:hypothetical protein
MMKLFFLIFFTASFSIAGELYQPGLPSRCLAMGGVCISQVKGAQALFINPAALNKVEGFDIILAQIKAGVSKDAVDFSSQMSGSNFSASDVNKLYGKTLMADIDGRSGFVMPNFGFGVYSNNYTTMKFNDPTFPTFNMNLISDYGYVVGGAFKLNEDSSMGATFRHVKRWGGNQDINVSSISGSSSNSLADTYFQDHGVGHALDLAYMTTFSSNPWKPTLAVVWRDVGVTKFNMTSGTQDPPREMDNLILGVSVEQDLSLIKLYHGLEYSFATDYSEDAAKKIHLGSELSFGPIDLRAGLNQGYVTYGVGLDLWFFEIEAASYATELGTYAGQERNDRYNVSITFEMDFDQSFKLLGANGKKRRLMQRR